MWPKVAEMKQNNPKPRKKTAFPPAPRLLSGPFSVTWRGYPVAALSTADSRGTPRAEEPARISLDCVSGRLLDKDHNMTLSFLCWLSEQRESSRSPGVPSSTLLIASLAPLQPLREKSFCQNITQCTDFFPLFR